MPFTPAEQAELDDGLYDEVRRQLEHPGDMPFICAITGNLGDGHRRCVFADYLFERGRDVEALGQCWAAKYGLYPYDARGRARITLGGWYQDDQRDAPAHSTLPGELFADSVSQSRGDTLEELLWCEELFRSDCARRQYAYTWA